MGTHTGDNAQIDWEEIIVRLEAFTRSFVKGKPWFRGGKTTSFVMGKEIKDYVFEAIGKYLEEPGKFDASKGDFLDYLKYNLIRSLISNDLSRKENKTTDDVFAFGFDDDDSNDSSPYLDRILPFTEALFDDDIDYTALKEFIEKEVLGDELAENIFLGVYCYGMKRREVIEEFMMTDSDYDNGMRRLKTIFNSAVVHFNINKQMV